jgi:predicted N-formylglutamate amidohydrolase
MSLPRGDYLIVTCEHGGNVVPSRFQKLFSKRFLSTHRGYDPGALALARAFAAATDAPLFHSTISRLLVELNRPLGHHQVFSARALRLPATVRTRLIERHYFPYWRAVETAVDKALRRGRRVLHLSCHSFTPKLAGVRRLADIGLLFDPARAAEARFCRAWFAALRRQSPGLQVRYNYPYRGASPSLVDSLRKELIDPRYVGIQIEINQKFPRGDQDRWRALRAALVASFQEALTSWSP